MKEALLINLIRKGPAILAAGPAAVGVAVAVAAIVIATSEK